jgi:hypothetical protein
LVSIYLIAQPNYNAPSTTPNWQTEFQAIFQPFRKTSRLQKRNWCKDCSKSKKQIREGDFTGTVQTYEENMPSGFGLVSTTAFINSTTASGTQRFFQAGNLQLGASEALAGGHGYGCFPPAQLILTAYQIALRVLLYLHDHARTNH